MSMGQRRLWLRRRRHRSVLKLDRRGVELRHNPRAHAALALHVHGARLKAQRHVRDGRVRALRDGQLPLDARTLVSGCRINRVPKETVLRPRETDDAGNHRARVNAWIRGMECKRKRNPASRDG